MFWVSALAPLDSSGVSGNTPCLPCNDTTKEKLDCPTLLDNITLSNLEVLSSLGSVFPVPSTEDEPRTLQAGQALYTEL